MASINDVVNVVVVNSAKSVSQKGFGTLLFITDTVPVAFKEVCRIYKGTKELLDDGFVATDKAYIAASTYFAQTPTPSQLVIAPITKKDDKTNDDWPTAINKISNTNSDWYGLATYTKVTDEIVSIAKYIDTMAKQYGVSSSEATIKDTAYSETTNDIASKLKRAGIKNTFVLYSGNANNFPECGWLGSGLAVQPGSATYAYKTITGISTDFLTPTQASNIYSKNANTYEFLAGQNIARYGVLSDGNYIDIKGGIDYISAKTQEEVYSLLVNSPKIPYTERGIASIQNKINGVCETGISRGVLESYSVKMPKPADVNQANKTARLLDDVLINLVMSGAIHKVNAQINYQL